MNCRVVGQLSTSVMQLASCLINAWPLPANEMGSDKPAVKSWHCRLNTFFY